MVLAFWAHVVRGMEVEEKQLLGKCYGSKKLGEYELSLGLGTVEDDGRSCVEEEGDGDGRVLEVVEMVGGNGSIWVKRLVAIWANEEFH